MTKIVSNLEDDRSFSIKSIEMEFYSHFRDGKLFEGFIGLVMLWFGSYTSNTGLTGIVIHQHKRLD